ncbi:MULTISPECIES: DUF6161 domain-containing protein [Flavobacterium]|uniref:DUF6161 domain-containing protein n=1 Tax=Flavobacterium hankyongi TaxID=1176532 RepID=A0ABP9A0R7_9FLAO|nr:DUF6161 domain-containing protein [Flavobacterium sp. N1846]
MELKDFRKLIIDSPIKDKLNNLEIVINFPYLDSTIKLKGIESIYAFVHDQVKGWNNIGKLPEYLISSKNYFESIRSKLLEIVDFSNENQHLFDTFWSELNNILSAERFNRRFIFTYDSPETDFIIEINNKNIGSTQGTIDYLTGQPISTNTSRDYLTGVLLAYEFKNQADSEISHRRNNEKISLGQIRTKYNEYIVEAEQHLNQYITGAKENLTDHFNSVDELKKEKNITFDDWLTTTQKEFTSFFDITKKSVSENENLYREKLRLEAPANYWNKRAIKLKDEGNKHLNKLIGISVISAILLFALLFFIGDDYFKSVFSDNLKGIKWSIILITIVSLLAFCIRILARLTFSSYHLSRDAEEREQLTHFYLALKHDTSVSDNDRQLILQSLFSRSDTGLLKEDSAPTMPSGIMEKYISK